jgi:hypothetical protein
MKLLIPKHALRRISWVKKCVRSEQFFFNYFRANFKSLSFLPSKLISFSTLKIKVKNLTLNFHAFNFYKNTSRGAPIALLLSFHVVPVDDARSSKEEHFSTEIIQFIDVLHAHFIKSSLQFLSMWLLCFEAHFVISFKN